MTENKNPVYLVMVTAENNNKYYRMIPHGDTFTSEYGRIGVSGFQTKTYPMSKWNSTYNSKIKKGYVDQTNLVKDLISPVKLKQRDGYTPIDNPSIKLIVDRLQQMANQVIQENYKISSNKVTQAMVDEAQTVLVKLISADTVESFNKILLELFTVIPRKMKKVNDYLANETSDFSRIISDEQDLLDVMKGQVIQKAVENDGTEEEIEIQKFTILDAMGLVFRETTKDDVSIIKKNLGNISDKYHQSWCVENIKTQKRFDEFLHKEKIDVTKLLWHGSRNENWWSIINSGLVLKPTNAVITGKMFGFGIYFAPKAQKSLGYTSLHGSYWARGSANSAFMSLYNVAYGTQYDAYSFENRFNSLTYDKLQELKKGANSLHAHAGSMLRNDEIIVYKEDQTTIKYLVELK